MEKPAQEPKLSNSASQLDTYLEQIRAKSKPPGDESWTEFAKQLRMATLDRTQTADSAVVGEALEKLRKVLVPQGLTQVLERLEAGCQKLRIKFSYQRSEQPRMMSVLIATEMFLVEITCDNQMGTVQDVLVKHHGTHRSSVPGMTQALKTADVEKFMEHIRGYMNMYNVTSDQAVKTKFFIVQQSLETDLDKLNTLFTQAKNYNVVNQIFKLPLGLIQSRNGGLPMKLVFYLTPYDRLDEENHTVYPLTSEVLEKKLGTFGSIGIDQHPNTHHLQTIPLMTVTRNAEGRMNPQFQSSNNINSSSMPAALYLTFNRSIPLSRKLINQIERLNGAAQFSSTLEFTPLLQAIVTSSGLDNSQSRTNYDVLLPEQYHSYRIQELGDDEGNPLDGALVAKLPFTHPTFLVQLIPLLRQQLLFNALISSCLRKVTGEVTIRPLSIELTTSGSTKLSATFKHPNDDSLVSVEFSATEVTCPTCSIYSLSSAICPDQVANQVLSKTFSIPLTIREIMRQADYKPEAFSPPTKRVKLDSSEHMDQIVHFYSSRGNYVPIGSVNTTNSNVSNNIKSNNYSLCLRRFAGYHRTRVQSLRPFNPIEMSSKAALRLATNNPKSIHNQSPNSQPPCRHIQNTPMLASLLDERGKKIVVEECQPTPAPLLSDLLGNDIDKKGKKRPVKRRPTSESLPTPGPASRKRKKSDNDEIVRDLYNRVQSEANEQKVHQAALSPKVHPPPSTPTNISVKSVVPVIKAEHRSSTPQNRGSPSLNDSIHKVRIKEEHIVNASLPLSQPTVVLSMPPIRASKIKEEKRKPAEQKEKKAKRNDNIDAAQREVKIIELTESPIRKPVPKTPPIKVKPGNSSPKAGVQNLNLKLNDEVMKVKPKKVQEKKRKSTKSPITTALESPKSSTTPSKLSQLGPFYGANNLSSLPKIPKKKQEAAHVQMEHSQSFGGATPPITLAALSKSKSFTAINHELEDLTSKRPALLPTPPEHLKHSRPPPQRKPSLSDVISKLTPSKFSNSGSSVEVQDINSPHQPRVLSNPKIIPIVHPEELPPASPDANETISLAPVSIPLDSNQHNSSFKTHSISNHVPSSNHRPISKSLTKTLTFSPKPNVGERLDDDLMDVALGCK